MQGLTLRKQSRLSAINYKQVTAKTTKEIHVANMQREYSEYVYNLSRGQLEALLAIVKNQDRPFLELVMEAVDQYIERERETCKTP